MRTDQDRVLQMMIQALHDGWVRAGEFAWVILGVLLLLGLLAMLMLLRWVWKGGLSRPTGIFQHPRCVQRSSHIRNDSC